MTTVLTSRAADSLRHRAQEASKHNTSSVLSLAAVLWQTFNNRVAVAGKEVSLHQAWGFNTWFEYVEHELGIHQTTAAAYRKIHEIFFIELSGAWQSELARPISYTKLKVLCRVVTKKNVNSWLKIAAKLSCCQLDVEVDRALGIANAGAIHTFSVPCTASEFNKLRKLVESARESFGDERRGKVLLQMLEEWSTIRARVTKINEAKEEAG